jgi:hypothetical protein
MAFTTAFSNKWHMYLEIGVSVVNGYSKLVIKYRRVTSFPRVNEK